MPSDAKKPRRTAERILETTLELFNRFGEPNVSTTTISQELGISPGNLYYHYPAKEELINRLFGRYESALADLLRAADEVGNVEDAWLFFHMLFELIWQYRFLYRDLNDLLSNNRRLETQFQAVLRDKTGALRTVLVTLTRASAPPSPPARAAAGSGPEATAAGSAGAGWAGPDVDAVATAMVVVLTYWLSFEFVRDPRHALEPSEAHAALLRGAFHVLSLLAPYLAPAEREHLHALAASYRTA